MVLKKLEYFSKIDFRVKTLNFTDFFHVFWYNTCKAFDIIKPFFLQFFCIF